MQGAPNDKGRAEKQWRFLYPRLLWKNLWSSRVLQNARILLYKQCIRSVSDQNPSRWFTKLPGAVTNHSDGVHPHNSRAQTSQGVPSCSTPPRTAGSHLRAKGFLSNLIKTGICTGTWMETVTKSKSTALIDSLERVIGSFYTDKGNPLDIVSKRYLTVTQQRLLRQPNHLEMWKKKVLVCIKNW